MSTEYGNFLLPIPLAAETPDVPGGMLALAQRLDVVLGTARHVADFTALAALSSSTLLPGAIAHVAEGNVVMLRNAANTGWVQVTAASFTTTTARDTAYAKAAAAFRVMGAEAWITDGTPDVLTRHDGTTWKIASPVINAVRAGTTAGSIGTVESVGAYGSVTTTPLSTTVVMPIAGRVKVTRRFQYSINAGGSGFFYDIKGTGATTINPQATADYGTVLATASMGGLYHSMETSIILNLNAGSTLLEFVVQAFGVGSTRNIANISLTVEAVSEA